MEDSPTVEHAGGLFNFSEDEVDPPSSGLLPKWFTSVKLLHKALLLVMAGLLFAALSFCCLPLLRPIGGLVLQRLWDVLRFLLLTTSVGLGILNSRSWRGGTDSTENPNTRAKEANSVGSKIFFAGMFYGEMQTSDSNNFPADREVDMSEGAVMSRNGSTNDGGQEAAMSIAESVDMAGKDDRNAGGGEEVAMSTAESVGMADKDDRNGDGGKEVAMSTAESVGMAGKDDRDCAVVHTEEYGAGHIETENQAANGVKGYQADTASHVDAVLSLHLLDDDDDVDASREWEVKLVDHLELGLSATMAGPEPNSARKRGNIVHRRGGSLMELALKEQQEYWAGSKFANDDLSSNVRRDQLQAIDNSSSSKKVPSRALNYAGSKGHRLLDGASMKALESVGSTSSSGKVPSITSNALVDDKPKESKSSKVSLFTDNKVVDGVDRKVRELSITNKELPSSDLATSRRTRHTRSRSELDMNKLLVTQQQPIKSRPTTSSVSCDLDREFSNTGALTSGLFAPPTPPFIWAMDDDKSILTESDLYKKEGESSLRKAFSESLVPWRSVSTVTHAAASVNVPAVASSSQRKQPMSSWTNSLVQDDGSPSPTMGSPSPGELNKKVDAFIARFHQQMRLQRLESMERASARHNPY